ncbi:sister chromatid cohesion protein PDS5 homolog C-like isoform X2 [Henckelia pumila]|uniref:sister chromatid cohesion protein PDS5 homolog C-like isoform X2 n=1 Tax=Henckelia pumila TaxID=405737 RepID=UPI003C6E9247
MAGSASPNGNMSDGDGEEIDMEEELKRVILECGNGLLKPCDSIEELLRKLDKMEHLLQHLRQAYKELVKTALEPAKIALISDDLLRHTEVEVRFTIASCITEIIRITAPDIPYREEQMKDYFLLVNTAFKELPSISGRSYSKVVSILQTISHCQICVMMLDYELHDLVHEMFRLFLNGIRMFHHLPFNWQIKCLRNVLMTSKTTFQRLLDA